MASTIRSVFKDPSRLEAERLLKQAVNAHAETAPGLAEWMEENIPEGLTAFTFDERLRLSLIHI